MDVLKFVIVGHVDHGKSTLIGRLLYDTKSLSPDKIEEIQRASKGLGKETEFAYLLDHLEEERQQGITIETTQVFFKSDKREYVIVDAPGHVEFMKNMITGASSAEAAVLIIDASEGIKEQTKRHAFILSLLGIKQIVVVINKMDLVNYDSKVFDSLRQELEQLLKKIDIRVSFYIPISALGGINITKKSEKMSWYQGPTFLESLNSLETRKSCEDKSLIFPIQDVYKIDNKRIGTGRIEAGSLEKGQRVKILPGNQSTEIETIEKYPHQVNKVYSGESIGITTIKSVFLNRGDVLCQEAQEPDLVDSFYANIFWLSKKEFLKGERLIIKCATQETSCTIEEIKKRIDSSTFELLGEMEDKLENLDIGQVLIKTKKPIAIKTFQDLQELGRFVLVRDENTCAGGIVTS